MRTYKTSLWALTLAILAGIVAVNACAETPSIHVGSFLQEVATLYTTENGLPADDVQSVSVDSAGKVVALTTKGTSVFADGQWKADASAPAVSPQDALLAELKQRIQASGQTVAFKANQVASDGKGRLAAAAAEGLLFVDTDGKPQWLKVLDSVGRQWAVENVLGVTFDSSGNLWFASKAGVGCRVGNEWKLYTGAEGLPYNDFTCAASGPNGEVWFGTHLGAIRVKDGEWAYREGHRWLPDDDVRSIAIDAKGNVWFGTAKGVGLIEYRSMTLAQKAEFYEDQAEKYIKRTEFGYLCEVNVKEAGKPESGIIYSDSDNDGLWTAMYGAGECFAYGATKNPAAKARAKKAFEALRFLQKVTQGCEFSPPKGYVARTIRPMDWPDPNIGRLEQDKKEKAKSDSLWKIYEPRWPKSADGKWYWKSDTSSDELDGHYFFYPLYYDLVADTDEEKERVREVVRDLTDHMLEHNYNLVDHDGTPTRWGYYGPDSLNNDPMWWQERGLKSLSLLSYLLVAEHMTGDAKYADAAKELIEVHGYRANLMHYKIHFGPGSGNQSDDEMAFMSYYNLMKYAKDETLQGMGRFSFHMAWINEQPEMNPFFNFAYAAFSENSVLKNPYGTYKIGPWGGWLEDSVATLTGFPLDRFDWAIENSHRLDLVPLPRQSAVEPTQEMHRKIARGHLNNGKVLPIENRHFNHWNTDPWQTDYNGKGTCLASGTVYLLPYYMGLYHGFIKEDQK